MNNNTISKEMQEFLRKLEQLTIEAALDTKFSISYRLLSATCTNALRTEFKETFDVSSYAELDRGDYEEAVSFLADWFPDDETMAFSAALEEGLEDYIYRYVEAIPKESPAYQQMMEDYMYAVCSGSERPY